MKPAAHKSADSNALGLVSEESIDNVPPAMPRTFWSNCKCTAKQSRAGFDTLSVADYGMNLVYRKLLILQHLVRNSAPKRIRFLLCLWVRSYKLDSISR